MRGVGRSISDSLLELNRGFQFARASLERRRVGVQLVA
jgi:hypothetical protein